MSKITEYASVTRFDANDVLIKDGTNGTKTIKAADAAKEFAGLVSAIQHRNVYRGKNLGRTITDAQKTAIHNATFDDLFIGDYWTINDHRYVIADMNYWKGRYDKLTAAEGEDPIQSVDKNHLVMIAMSAGTAKMNDTNTIEGAYLGSKMYAENLAPIRATIAEDFGDLVIHHREVFSNAVDPETNIPSNHVWVDSYADLMNEPMVYGGFTHSPTAPNVINHDHYTIDREQLALFRLNPNEIVRSNFWLRDVVTASAFAFVSGYGSAYSYSVSYACGVRPAFALAP